MTITAYWKKDKGQQTSPPNLNRSWHYRIIPSVLEAKGKNAPAITFYCINLSLAWLIPISILFIYILDALQSNHQYTPEYFSSLARGLRIYVSNKFSGDVDAADPPATLRTLGLKQQRTQQVPKNTLYSRIKTTL